MRKLCYAAFLITMFSQVMFAGRYYDARVGRFLQVDPHSYNHPEFSSYAYGGDNPLKNIDPDGNDWWDAVKGGANAALGAAFPSLATSPSEYYNGDRGDYRSGYTAVAVANLIMGADAATFTPTAVAGTVGLLLAGETGGTSVAVVAGAGALAVAGGTVAANSAALLQQDATHLMNENKGGSYENTSQNMERMSEGKAPIGKDGNPVELHHEGQAKDGNLKEMTRTDHRLGDNFKKNHENTGQQSQINRSEFKKIREGYWKNKADQ